MLENKIVSLQSRFKHLISKNKRTENKKNDQNKENKCLNNVLKESFTDSLRNLGFANTIDDIDNCKIDSDLQNKMNDYWISFKKTESENTIVDNSDIRKTMQLWNQFSLM